MFSFTDAEADTGAEQDWRYLPEAASGVLTSGNRLLAGQSILDSIRKNRRTLRGQKNIIFERLQKLGISTDIFERAQSQALQNGSALIQVLFCDGTLSPEDYYGLLAQELGVEFSATIDPETVLMEMGHATFEFHRTAQVFCRSVEGLTVLHVAPDSVCEQALRELVELRPDNSKRICITTPKAIQDAILARLSSKALHEATDGLHRRSPELSARFVITPWQGFAIGCFLCLFPIFTYLELEISLASIHMLASSIFAFGLYVRLGALRQLGEGQSTELTIPAGTANQVPIYSVLVALYKEAAVAGQLVEAMSKLDWCADRLEIFYVCEADDRETIEALTTKDLAYNHRIIEVPPGALRTKPKALNYALQFTSGDVLVIYDAEDRPHAGQLRQAWDAMTRGGEQLGCVQAPLRVTNGSASWLAHMFAFEYEIHFKALLPHLARLGVPLPLGGTSNHFRREALLTVGGWDPYNVTEDADLGIRLARHGYRCGVITLPTLEDAPESFGEWKPQRTRWQKGWMQTALVHSRDIPALINALGWRSAIHFYALMIGFIFSPLLYPFALLVVGAGLIWHTDGLTLFGVLDLLLMPFGFLAYALLGYACDRRMGLMEKTSLLFSLPFYWLLQSYAAWRGLFQLIYKPHDWEKTPHRPTQGATIDGHERPIMPKAALHPIQ